MAESSPKATRNIAGTSEGAYDIVSVVVPTRNSEEFLSRCLASIRAQTYPAIEVIVVDNHSTDNTRAIASKLADVLVTAGPERSAQCNFGASLASGRWVFRVDSDFELDRHVVTQCIASTRSGALAVIVHNSPDGSVGWLSRLRRFEVDMYKYDLTFSAARFLERDLFLRIGGYDIKLVAGEDYDLQNRLNRAGVPVAFVAAEALHLGEPRSIREALQKHYMYGQDFVHFRRANTGEARRQLSPLRMIYIRRWRSFVRHPIVGAGFLFYHISKFAAGGAGYLVARLVEQRQA